MSSNHVRRARETLGLTQKDVAQAVAISRQSLNAIETGRAIPSVAIALKLARALGRDVESLFVGAENESLEALVAGPVQRVGSRVMLAQVRERWVAHPLTGTALGQGAYAADGFVRRAARRGPSQIEAARSLSDLRSGLFIGGCAPGLGVLCDYLNGSRGPGRFRWLMQANNVALRELSRGHTHLAGIHLAKGDRHKPAQSVGRHLPTSRASLYALANWEAGLIVAPGNPKRIRSTAQLSRPTLRFALREAGSGARAQLERLLKETGLEPALIEARSLVARSHMEVAAAVHLGAADVGFSIRAAAQALGLCFIPLVEERFDLIVPDDLANDARVLRLLDTIASGWFRNELAELGYDPAVAGDKVGEVAAP